MAKFDKFFKILNKIIFWIDLDKETFKKLIPLLVCSFIFGAVAGPLFIVFIIGFLSTLR